MSRIFRRCACRWNCRHAWWYRFQLHGQLYTKSTKTARKDLAQRILVQAQHQVLEGRHRLLAPTSPRLSAHIHAYCAHTAATNVSSNKDRRVLDGWLACIGDRHLHEVTPFHLERWKQQRLKAVSRRGTRLSPATVNRELTIIRACVRWAVTCHLLRVSPAVGVKPYKTDGIRIRVLSSDEQARLLGAADLPTWLLCRVTLESLLRLSEARRLHRDDIGASCVTVRRKGGKIQRVPVTPDLRLELLAAVHQTSGYVFGEGVTGTIPTQQTVTNRVRRLALALGLSGVSHHTLRHTGASAMVAAGHSLRAVQEIGGWSSLTMLERYTHPTSEELQRAVATLAPGTQGTRAGTGANTTSAKSGVPNGIRTRVLALKGP